MCVVTPMDWCHPCQRWVSAGSGEGVGQPVAAVPLHTTSPAAPLVQTQLQRWGSHLCVAGSRKLPQLMLGKFLSL